MTAFTWFGIFAAAYWLTEAAVVGYGAFLHLRADRQLQPRHIALATLAALFWWVMLPMSYLHSAILRQFETPEE
jgi:hypothetical protein